MDRLRFGTAGRPLSTAAAGTHEGVMRVRELGLECMELEFVHSVNLAEAGAKLVKSAADKADVALTVHAPYFINLNPREERIGLASVQRILKSARIGFQAGAKSMTFHAAFYLGMDKEKVYNSVRDRLSEISATLRSEGNTIMIRPELTGKETQFGDLAELIRLSQEVEGVMPCIDFAHYYARYIGRYNSKADFTHLLAEIENNLGKAAIADMHIHMSGIEHGQKGERMHHPLKESGFNYHAVLEALHDFRAKGVVICESPNIEEDAALMQRDYARI